MLFLILKFEVLNIYSIYFVCVHEKVYGKNLHHTMSDTSDS